MIGLQPSGSSDSRVDMTCLRASVQHVATCRHDCHDHACHDLTAVQYNSMLRMQICILLLCMLQANGPTQK